MATKEKKDHYIRLGMTPQMRDDIERWRIDQGLKTGKVPSFSDAARQLIQIGLDAKR